MDSCVVGIARNGLTLEWVELKILGSGSSGVVYLIKPTNSVSDDQVFAVKSCLYEDSSSLQKERQIFKQFLGCDRIVQCYGDMLSIDQGMLVYNLFLEYAPDGSLLDLMINKYGGKIPECDVKCYARMLLEGVRDIHRRGYVHCDLKPENILVFPPHQCGSINRLKIADFGLARRPRDMPDYEQRMQIFPGTAVYMPPECVNNWKISTALDIWSLGCVVLQMMTGRLPWEYKNMQDLGVKIGYSTSPKIPETMSSTGKDFLMECFQRDPSKRWTADMLLCHPFLLRDCPSFPSPTKPLHHDQVDGCMEQIKAMCLECLCD